MGKPLVKKVLLWIGILVLIILIVLLISIGISRNHTIKMSVVFAEDGVKEKDVSNPIIKVFLICKLKTLRGGESTTSQLDIAQLYAVPGKSLLMWRSGDKDVTYYGLDWYDPQGKAYPLSIGGEGLKKYTGISKSTVECFRVIYDFYFDLPESWYEDYEAQQRREP